MFFSGKQRTWESIVKKYRVHYSIQRHEEGFEDVEADSPRSAQDIVEEKLEELYSDDDEVQAIDINSVREV